MVAQCLENNGRVCTVEHHTENTIQPGEHTKTHILLKWLKSGVVPKSNKLFVGTQKEMVNSLTYSFIYIETCFFVSHHLVSRMCTSPSHRETDHFLELQEFSLCILPVTSSITTTWCSPHDSDRKWETSSSRLDHCRLR